jgi:5-methyltetrahydrofolate--homocysteine methyltransferase
LLISTIIDRIKCGEILVSDGAWGTFLHRKGLQPGECPELWNVTHREEVLDIARSYIHAGADMIETNSFGGSSFKLEHYGLSNRTAELNEVSAAISREAAGNDHFVLGSIGPTGKILMMGEVTETQLSDNFKVQSEALQKGGVDAICIETMSALDEACLAVKAARENTNLTVICTMTFDKMVSGEYRTMMGISPAEMVPALLDAGADIIGTNCGNGMAHMVDIVREIRSVNSDVPILVHANAGAPVFRNGETVFPESPEETAGHVKALIQAGVNIVGGCCGTTPEHIRLIASKVHSLKLS